jgi:hypothetical protein
MRNMICGGLMALIITLVTGFWIVDWQWWVLFGSAMAYAVLVPKT